MHRETELDSKKKKLIQGHQGNCRMPSTYFGQGLGWTLPSILFLWVREKCAAHGSGLYLGTLDRSSGLPSRERHQMREITGPAPLPMSDPGKGVYPQSWPELPE